MFSRVWHYIANLLGLNIPNQLTILPKKQKKERFLIVQDPYIVTKSKQNTKNNMVSYPMPKNSAQLLNIYKLQQFKDDNQKRAQKQIIAEINKTDEFIYNMKEMDDCLKKIEQMQYQIQQIKTDSQIVRKVDQVNKLVHSIEKAQNQQRQLFHNYIKVIEDIVKSKYLGQLLDYPNISYEYFKYIREYWAASFQDLSLVNGYRFLHRNSIYYLKDSGWLNDQVLTEYINFMNEKLQQRENNTYYIIDSVKSQSIFAKADYRKIQKILEKNRVSRNTTMIIAINKKRQKHWIFLKMDKQNIFVYDSMLTSVEKCLEEPLIVNIHKFATYYYGLSPQISIISNFPKQNNGYDCGVMMLCGIKDVVRNKQVWSFSQKQIPYKRYLMTGQIINKKISGFDFD